MANRKTEIEIPKIYVACLAAYNSGHPHGAWIDADQGAWEIYDEIKAILKASPIAGAEEFAIHDYEGFEGVRIAESQGLGSVVEIAAFIIEHGALGGALIEYFGDIAEAKTAIEDHYAGEYSSLADFAQELTEEGTAIPENLRFYIDYERMARDLAINDVLTIETAGDQVHVFWSR